MSQKLSLEILQWNPNAEKSGARGNQQIFSSYVCLPGT
jgi:hypothetical protein